MVHSVARLWANDRFFAVSVSLPSGETTGSCTTVAGGTNLSTSWTSKSVPAGCNGPPGTFRQSSRNNPWHCRRKEG